MVDITKLKEAYKRASNGGENPDDGAAVIAEMVPGVHNTDLFQRMLTANTTTPAWLRRNDLCDIVFRNIDGQPIMMMISHERDGCMRGRSGGISHDWKIAVYKLSDDKEKVRGELQRVNFIHRYDPRFDKRHLNFIMSADISKSQKGTFVTFYGEDRHPLHKEKLIVGL